MSTKQRRKVTKAETARFNKQMIKTWKNHPPDDMALAFGEFEARRREHDPLNETWAILSMIDAAAFMFDIVYDNGFWRLFSENVHGPGSDSSEGRAAVVAVGHALIEARNEQKEEGRLAVLESTRSHDNEDSWRDMDDFNENEELKRLRNAVVEVALMNIAGFERHQKWSIAQHNERIYDLLAFVCEAFTNIDEHLCRGGDLPRAWLNSSSVGKTQRQKILSKSKRIIVSKRRRVSNTTKSSQG
jgi:hypothetical protein